jgi:hypothetical protein
VKHDPEIAPMAAGRRIDLSALHESNADSPRVESLEPDSNAKIERPMHALKHDLAIVSTEAGSEID